MTFAVFALLAPHSRFELFGGFSSRLLLVPVFAPGAEIPTEPFHHTHGHVEVLTLRSLRTTQRFALSQPCSVIPYCPLRQVCRWGTGCFRSYSGVLHGSQDELLWSLSLVLWVSLPCPLVSWHRQGVACNSLCLGSGAQWASAAGSGLPM